MIKKLIVVLLIILLFIVAAILRLLSPEDTWLCQNGNWVKHGHPQKPQPTTTCGTSSSNETPPVACTMDAKICPDGSAVGRIAPNCEFAPCP